jgi:periplasmic divalent cation tolerance protein
MQPGSTDGAAMMYVTFPSLDEAERVAGLLLDSRCVACVNILPGMISLYDWQGKRQRDAEVVMLIKTRRSCCDSIIDIISREHPYDVPAILAFDVATGFPPFLAWIEEQTTPSDAVS